jgi:hypothetical protein
MYSKGKLARGNFEQGRGYCEQAGWYIARVSQKMMHFRIVTQSAAFAVFHGVDFYQ